MADRRLLVLVCAVALVEALFFAALTPLLPELSREFGLSKTGVGVLSGAYPAGGAVGALGGAWLATRSGLRTTTVVGVLVLAVCCAGFGLGDQVWLLDSPLSGGRPGPPGRARGTGRPDRRSLFTPHGTSLGRPA